MLELDRLMVRLGELDFEFSLHARRSETIAILGRSGAGKSTLLALIGGFLEAQSGSLEWDSASILNIPPNARPVTSLFQSHNLFDHLSVANNIALGIHPGLKLNQAEQSRVQEVLDQVGLEGFDNRLPTQLSGGEQQRVALARCLVRERPILLLDEPYSALDQETREEMLELTTQLIKAEKLCTLLVTHNHEDAEALGAKKFFLENRRLLAKPD